MVGLNEAKNGENPTGSCVDERSVRSKESQQQDTFSFNMRPPNQTPENPQPNPAYKTKLCRNFQMYQNCFYNGQCLFAHGFDDLAPYVRERYLRGELDPIQLQTVPPVVRTTDAYPICPLHVMPTKQQQSDPVTAHSSSKRIKYKTRICNKYPHCPYGSRCQFAHNQRELRQEYRHNFFKTVRCVNFDRGGYCPYGQNCHYIHDEKEGEQPEQNNRADLSLYTSVTPFSLASAQFNNGSVDDLTPQNEVSRAVTVDCMMAQLAINSPQKPNNESNERLAQDNDCQNDRCSAENSRSEA